MVNTILHRAKVKLYTLLQGKAVCDVSHIDQVGSSNERLRNEWIKTALSQLKPGLRILDAGAGEQPYKKYCTHLHYVSQDFAQYNPEESKAGLQMQDWNYGKLDIISDVTAIPEPDASFDVILCTEVIEHIVNPIEAIAEFARLLKPGGQLILTAPFCSITHFAPHHYYSGYNRFFYQEVLSKYDFEIVEMTENGNYFEYLAQELRRLERMGDQYANVKQDQRIKESVDEILQYLNVCSGNDKGSKELLYFGMHVLAIKKNKVAS